MTMPQAMRRQAAACDRLGSPFMARLLELLAESWQPDTRLAKFCDGFKGDIGASGHSLPLRFASALNGLRLRGEAPLLDRVYPPSDTTDTALNNAVWMTVAAHETAILDWMRSPPQTNEVRRSAGLIPAAHWLSARFGLPLVTSELGASAGLNMTWDRYALDTARGSLGPDDPVLYLIPDWEGDMPAQVEVALTQRAGVDLNPLNPRVPEQKLRLLSYLWPDQPYRMDLTRAAASVQETRVEQGDAIDWLEDRLRTVRPGALHLVYHTIAWQYFAPAAQARGRALIEAAGSRASPRAPLAWLAIEDDGKAPGAGIQLRMWPGDQRVELGRMDYHGRWVHWTAPPAT